MFQDFEKGGKCEVYSKTLLVVELLELPTINWLAEILNGFLKMRDIRAYT